MTQEEIDEDEERWYCWEEADWSENKLFYEHDLEHLEEIPMTQEQQALIDKATSRENLGRGEQRRLGLELKDALTLNKYAAKAAQADKIKEMVEEIIISHRVLEDFIDG